MTVMCNTFQPATQHKKVLFLISLPYLPEYMEYFPEAEHCCHELESLGVEVRNEISKDTMKDMTNYDVVIVVSHLDEDTDELVLADSRISIAGFINCIPDGFSGFLDFASCHSSLWNNSIKEKCPNCRVSGAEGQTSLLYRLYIYPFAVQMFQSDESISYEKAYSIIHNYIIQEKERTGTGATDDEDDDYRSTTTLGNKISWVFAPTKVVKQKNFMVQVFLFDSAEPMRQIVLQAKRYDSKTRLVERHELPIKIKKGDRISVQFNALSVPPEQIIIDNAVKEIKWNGKSGIIQFNVTVLEGFDSDSFTGKLIIEVNHEPVGESSFRIRVGEKENLAPSKMNLKVRDYYSEGEDQKKATIKQLHERIANLNKQIESASDEQTKSNLKREMDTCKRNLKILENPVRDTNSARRKKVFISSTCEDYMKPFRKTVCDVVNSLKMEPEWSDDWSQSAYPPTDVCCQKVMDSDIYLGIFGGRYGHIDPSLDASMTQIEYYTAVGNHKEILLFIIDPLNKTDEPEPIRKRQEDFVKSVRDSRVLHVIKNVDELTESSRNDLLDLISRK